VASTAFYSRQDSHVMRAATTATRADGVTATATRWHSRLGHLHLDGLIKLNTLVTDFEFKRVDGQSLRHCEACIAGKLHCAAMPRAAQRRATDPSYLTHSDICEPMPIRSISGGLYFITFIDDCSWYIPCRSIALKTRHSRVLKGIKPY
jgi:hypothetical protein